MDVARKLHSIVYSCLPTSTARGDYVRRHRLFGRVGEDVRLPSGHIPLRSEAIVLHDNIEVASGAMFIPHDAIHSVFSRMDAGEYPEHVGRIEVFDNVFIGANAIVLGPVRIGPNAIVAAGAVVCSDVPPGSIVGGVPARVIGSFSELKAKRKRQVLER